MIGNEVMFVAADEASACAVALALLNTAENLEGLSRIRVGLAAGPVLTGYRDYHGPVANLASRLASAAAPGRVLVSGAVRRQAERMWVFTRPDPRG